MQSSAAQYPTLGFDPAPGDPDALDGVLLDLSSVTSSLEETYGVLSGDDSSRWVGKAADAFRENVHGQLTPAIEKAHASFSGATSTLRSWQSTMLDYQQRARSLESQAAGAASSLSSARTALANTPAKPADPSTPDPHADARNTLTSSASNADSELETYRSRARTLLQDYNDEGSTQASQFHDAESIAPHKPGFWSSLGNDLTGVLHGLENVVGEIGHLVGDANSWLHDVVNKFKGLIEAISNVLSIISAVCGLLALIPPLTAVFLPLSVATAGLAMLGHTLLAVYAHGSWFDVALDALGVVSGAGAFRMLGKIAELGTEGGEAARTLPGFARLAGGAIKGGEDGEDALTGLDKVFPKVLMPAKGTGFFSMAKSIGTDDPYLMSDAELPWRAANLVNTQAGIAMSTVGTIRSSEGLAGVGTDAKEGG